MDLLIRPALPAESLHNPTEACLQLHTLYAQVAAAAGVDAHTQWFVLYAFADSKHTCALTFLTQEQKIVCVHTLVMKARA